MKKNKKINTFFTKINTLLIDNEIKELINEKIVFYLEYGKMYLDNTNLYGTYVNTNDLSRANPTKEFLEIKIIDNNLICNFSEFSNKKIINITQTSLKGGNTSI